MRGFCEGGLDQAIRAARDGVFEDWSSSLPYWLSGSCLDERVRNHFRTVVQSTPIFKWLIISVGVIVAAGAVFQFSMAQWDRHRYPAPGKLVDIGGLRLHINCTGVGSPAVVMEAGPNDSSIIWQLVQPQISKFTRVCSYDRAGFGWSDAPNEPRSSLNIANELARLLTRAAVPGPYVLLGHDFGTLDLRVFTARHRQEVAGDAGGITNSLIKK